ncbi:MAG: glycosyltransferase family 4 protein [Bacteroidota bacterium]
MKLFFLTGSINQGGAEFQLLKLAQLCVKKGHSVSILALTDYDFYRPFVEENLLPYEALSNHDSKARRVLQVVKKINEYNPEVVIAYLREVSLVAMMAKLLSRRKFKLVIGERTSLIIPSYDRFYFQLCRLAGAITVNSLSKKTYIEKRFSFLEKKLFFTPNILSLEQFEWTKTSKVPKKIIRLGYVGRISKEKNLINLIKALGKVNERFEEWTLEMYGGVRDQAYFDEIQELIEELGVTDKVIYRGVTNNVHEVYQRIEALCLLSIFEGFSNVLSEALSSGIPILASNIEENAFLVEDKINGFLVDRYDIEEIAQGLISLLQLDSSGIERIHQANKQKALELFDEDKAYERFLSAAKLEYN